MEKVKIEEHKKVAVLRMTSGVINAINPELIDDFSEAVKQVQDNFEGLILAGNEKFFSIGLDLPHLMNLDQAEMTSFWHQFNQLTFDLFSLPLPTASAIAGHATAGGNILALTSDFRLFASGKKLIGLNEVKLGLPVPYLVDLMLRQVVGDRAATEMTYRGNFLDPDQARQIGLVDEILDVDAVENRAIELISEIASHPKTGIVAIKSNRVEFIRERYEKNQDKKCAEFLECWSNEETINRLKAACKKF
jgi:enoyl-CoA hydratase/carnithine racemase